MKQVQVRIKPRTRQQLETLADELMSKDQVLYAHLNLASLTLQANSAHAQEPPIDEGQKEFYKDFITQNKPANEWWHKVIGLQEALEDLPKAEDLVKVGVLDDGFDRTHPDLNLVFLYKKQETKSYVGYHGTHVAGIVQQVLPNAQITVLDSYRSPAESADGRFETQCHHMKFLVDMIEANVKVLTTR